MDKIPSSVFKHVELELCNYHQTARRYQLRREELMFGSSVADENVGGGKSNLPGNPTERVAIALVMDQRLQVLDNIVTSIEDITSQLPPERMQFVRLKYWSRPQTLTWDGLAIELHCSRSVLFKWRRELVFALAERFGWV